MGVSPSGAADPISLRLGNRLVGNPDDAAALEMTLLGGTFLFPEGAILALSGSDFGATLDGVPIEPWTCVRSSPRTNASSWAHALGSAQLFLRTRRHRSEAFSRQRLHAPLERSRRLRRQTTAQGRRAEHRRAHQQPFRKRTIAPHISSRLAPRKILRVTPGPQSDWFPESSRHLFYDSTYRVAEESNRMGLRLEGPPCPASPADT